MDMDMVMDGKFHIHGKPAYGLHIGHVDHVYGL